MASLNHLVAIGRLRRVAAVQGLGGGMAELEVELSQAESDYQRARLFYAAHSDFQCDLVIVCDTVSDGIALREPAEAGAREGLAAAIRRNLPALTLNVGQIWSDKLSGSLKALQTPVTTGALLQVVTNWLTILSQQAGRDLYNIGQARIRRDALRLRLALACSESSAARRAELALQVMNGQRLGELPPAEPSPAERLPARLPGAFPQAEALPAEPLPAESMLALPSLRRPRRGRPSFQPRGAPPSQEHGAALGGTPVAAGRDDFERRAGLSAVNSLRNLAPVLG